MEECEKTSRNSTPKFKTISAPLFTVRFLSSFDEMLLSSPWGSRGTAYSAIGNDDRFDDFLLASEEVHESSRDSFITSWKEHVLQKSTASPPASQPSRSEPRRRSRLGVAVQAQKELEAEKDAERQGEGQAQGAVEDEMARDLEPPRQDQGGQAQEEQDDRDSVGRPRS